jgi:hypothetical protein
LSSEEALQQVDLPRKRRLAPVEAERAAEPLDTSIVARVALLFHAPLIRAIAVNDRTIRSVPCASPRRGLRSPLVGSVSFRNDVRMLALIHVVKHGFNHGNRFLRTQWRVSMAERLKNFPSFMLLRQVLTLVAARSRLTIPSQTTGPPCRSLSRAILTSIGSGQQATICVLAATSGHTSTQPARDGRIAVRRVKPLQELF